MNAKRQNAMCTRKTMKNHAYPSALSFFVALYRRAYQKKYAPGTPVMRYRIAMIHAAKSPRPKNAADAAKRKLYVRQNTRPQNA
eukprot:31153-Pelagococcus_subviridis.AAC.3